MKRVSAHLLLVLLVGTTTAVRAHEKRTPPETTVDAAGTPIHITATSKTGELAFTVRGEKSTPVRLPNDAWPITELCACEWREYGVALAVETRSVDKSRYRYYWATVWFDSQKLAFHSPVVTDFLDSKRDRDIVGIVNSGGESIYIVIGKHYHNLETVGAYVFVHGTPFWPRGGQLYQMTAEPIKRPRISK